MSITRILAEQHRAIETLFDEVADEVALETRPRARARAASRLTEELIAHMAAEETIFYPAARSVLGRARHVSGPGGRATDEHFMLRVQLRRVLGTNLRSSAFAPRFDALRLLFAHHVQVEETEIFPLVDAALAPSQLRGLAAKVLDSRPPIWVVTTETQGLDLPSRDLPVRGVRLPSLTDN